MISNIGLANTNKQHTQWHVRYLHLISLKALLFIFNDQVANQLIALMDHKL